MPGERYFLGQISFHGAGPSGIAQLRLQEFCHNGTTGMPGERYFLGRISFHGVNIIPSLKG